jgi:hypothetical protein
MFLMYPELLEKVKVKNPEIGICNYAKHLHCKPNEVDKVRRSALRAINKFTNFF